MSDYRLFRESVITDLSDNADNLVRERFTQMHALYAYVLVLVSAMLCGNGTAIFLKTRRRMAVFEVEPDCVAVMPKAVNFPRVFYSVKTRKTGHVINQT